ncbi:MAG: sulfatase-like hydrolase/transferase [Anaerolineae bacterium]|nr:sulfatase-like hydrolase/transferase [Anaerolineae bacterium]
MQKPNIVIIMTDQQRADASAREGFPLDTTPFLDSLARSGVWFNRAYTSAPVCAPARISMLTGRYPSAHRIRKNRAIHLASYDRDLIDVLREQGYATALAGKNHSHLKPERLDHWFELSHEGGRGEGRTADEMAFDQWLTVLNHGVSREPTPFPLECQGPYRAVTDSQAWIRSLQGRPFFLWLSFAEPHSPYQVPEPYFSLFPIETLPPMRVGKEALAQKGFKWEWTKHIGTQAYPNYDALLPRMRANYFGMMRLIDDQVRRFVAFLEAEGLRDNTLIVFVSDHGDFAGDYGLMRKGPEMPEVLMRVPTFVTGPGVKPSPSPHPAHVSMVDIMPTLCEAAGIPLPDGVQGRSLWPLLTGDDYPAEEFAAVYAEQGFGGLHYTESDPPVPDNGFIIGPRGLSFDELNSHSQSGTMVMLREGNWKLLFDMQGRGQLYNLARDPLEMGNLYGKAEHAETQNRMLAELLAWALRTQDTLPLPKGKYAYVLKRDPRNYWTPYR